MSDRRPVRLTFPAYDMDAFRIMADGKRKVGYVLGEFYGYRAYLFTEADPEWWDYNELENVHRMKLRELRAALRERVAAEGPWWT